MQSKGSLCNSAPGTTQPEERIKLHVEFLCISSICLNDKTPDGRQGVRQRVRGPGIELLAPTTNSNAPTGTAASASNFVHEPDKLPDTGALFGCALES